MLEVCLKQKILKERYQVQRVNRKDNITLKDVLMDIDQLQTKVKAKEWDFHAHKPPRPRRAFESSRHFL